MKSIKLKNGLIYAGSVLILSMFVYILAEFAKSKEIVAEVGNLKIYKEQVNVELEEKYTDMVIQNLINDTLIEQAYFDSGFTYTEEDLKNSLVAIQHFDRNKVDLEDLETREFAIQYTMVRQLIDGYIINDNDLEEYVEGIIECEGEYLVHTTAFYGDENQIEEMKKMDSADKVKKYAQENDLFSIDRSVMSESNYYAMNLSNTEVGSVVYYDGCGEQEDIYSEIVSVVIVTDREYVKDFVLNIKKNREGIIESYCSKNYFQCKLSLQNVLQGIYRIAKK